MLLSQWNSLRLLYPIVIAGMLALLIAPAVWSAITTQQSGGLVPSAGPSASQAVSALAGGAGGMFGRGGADGVNGGYIT